jgi:hypothetical protein
MVMYHPALPVILGFIALLFIAIPAWALLQSQRSRERGIPGVAKIVEKEDRPFAGAFHCWVEFAGRRCRVPVNKDTWRALRPGEPLRIRYDPDKPGDIRLFNTDAPPQSTLIYSALMIFGCLVATAAWRLWFS